MRLIDADALWEEAFKVWGIETDGGETNLFMEMINNSPTISPTPNDPLTLEELREMEGKPFPVWCDKVNGYIFIAATKTEPYNQVWFFNHKGRCDTVLYYHTEFYRCNPNKVISVSPKVYGKWVWFEEENGNPLSGFDYNYGWKCSRCGFLLPNDYDDPDCEPKIKYCQNCGAKLGE